MHLGIVRLKYTPFGGAERIIQRLVSSLSTDSGLRKITIFSSDWKDNQASKESRGGDVDVDVVKIKSSGIGRFWRQTQFLKNTRKAILQRPTINILQSHERLIGSDIFRTGDGVHAAWLDRLARQRNWLSAKLIRSDPFHRLICANEKKLAADPKTIFVANSPLAKREVQSYLKVPDSRIRLIPNGIDVSHWRSVPRDENSKIVARHRFGLYPERPCVIFVGSGFERKGLGELIKAVALLKDIQLLVVGRDRHLRHYQEIASRLAPGRIKFAGGLNNVETALASADVFCLPSLYDSFSNAALEALAVGLPVVVTENTGITDYIKDSGGGLICDRNPDSIKICLETALKGSRVLSQQAQLLAQQFDHSVTTPLWLNLYQTILNKESSS
jgi:UDP-glucose:(heptosyl)LPS alpha-1,3-glucosyltransferase